MSRRDRQSAVRRNYLRISHHKELGCVVPIGDWFTNSKLRVVQFALPPLAASLALRYTKARRLSVSIGMRLRGLLDDDLSSVPIVVSPPDWDIVRDVAVRVPSVSNFFAMGTSVTMFGLAIAGAVVNLVDAKDSSISWAATVSLDSSLH